MAKTAADMARIAREVVAGRKRGLQFVTINGVDFNTLERGWCSKYVRQAHHAVTGVEWPTWAGLFAVWTERNLARMGARVSQPNPGDIVCFNATEYARLGRDRIWNAAAQSIRDWSAQGHIGVWVGNGEVAENTASGTRGDPRAAGTKISKLSEIGAHRVSGCYAVLPTVSEAPEEDAVKLLHETEEGINLLTAEGRIIGDRLWVPARNVLESLGYTVDATKLKAQGQVIVRGL